MSKLATATTTTTSRGMRRTAAMTSRMSKSAIVPALTRSARHELVTQLNIILGSVFFLNTTFPFT